MFCYGVFPYPSPSPTLQNQRGGEGSLLFSWFFRPHKTGSKKTKNDFPHFNKLYSVLKRQMAAAKNTAA